MHEYTIIHEVPICSIFIIIYYSPASNVRVCTMIKKKKRKGIPNAWIHNNTCGPNMFYFHYHILHLASIISYYNSTSIFLRIISFLSYLPCVYCDCISCQFVTLHVNHIIYHSCYTYSNPNVFMPSNITIHICIYHIISYIITVT